MTSSTTTQQQPKTIYLIRHAQSEENRRLASAKTAIKDLFKFSLPKSSDIYAGMELINIPAQIDSNVSPVGKSQINEMADALKSAKFLETEQVEMVVHSPLLRAKETSMGMLGCAAPDSLVAPVQRVLELDLLLEKTPAEWTIRYSSFVQRLSDFETWLEQQSESKIVLVGHSQFFKALLHLDFKFGNCDVWKVEFGGQQVEQNADDATAPKWSNLQKLFNCTLSDIEPNEMAKEMDGK
jgi:broad specificity phosphatase PhoE